MLRSKRFLSLLCVCALCTALSACDKRDVDPKPESGSSVSSSSSSQSSSSSAVIPIPPPPSSSSESSSSEVVSVASSSAVSSSSQAIQQIKTPSINQVMSVYVYDISVTSNSKGSNDTRRITSKSDIQAIHDSIAKISGASKVTALPPNGGGVGIVPWIVEFRTGDGQSSTYRYSDYDIALTAPDGIYRGDTVGASRLAVQDIVKKYQPIIPHFSLTAADVSSIKIFSNTTKTYTTVSDNQVYTLINSLNPVAVGLSEKGIGFENQNTEPVPYLGAKLTDIEDMVVTGKDGFKLVYKFYEKGIVAFGTAYDKNSLKDEFYLCQNTDNYKRLLDLLRQIYQTKGAGSFWLGSMSYDKITSFNIYRYSDGKIRDINQRGAEFDELYNTLQGISVEPSSYQAVSTTSRLRNPAIEIKVRFSTDVTYTISFTDTELLIQSSDMDYGVYQKLVQPITFNL